VLWRLDLCPSEEIVSGMDLKSNLGLSLKLVKLKMKEITLKMAIKLQWTLNLTLELMIK
jgi:hypothetical protein